MYCCDAFISLQGLYSIFLLTFTFGCSSAEPGPDKNWSNYQQDIRTKRHNYGLEYESIDRHLLNGKVILLSDDPITSKSTLSTAVNQSSVLHSISSTTCMTITKTNIIHHTSTSTLSSSLGHRGRRLLNEPSSDHDLQTLSTQTPMNDENEIESFLKVDEEEMSRQLFNIEATTDGSGENETTQQTSAMTTVSDGAITSQSSASSTTTTSITGITETSSLTMTTTPPEPIVLLNTTQFILKLDSNNASLILNDILKQFKNEFKHWYNVSVLNENASGYIRILNSNVRLTFITDNNLMILTDVFRVLTNIASRMSIELLSVDQCGSNSGTVVVKNVTSCYLIHACGLCGTNPRRGECYPESGLSVCRCFVNEKDPSRPYVGERCFEQDSKSITSTRLVWIPIIIGILAGVTALSCVIASYLLIMMLMRRRRRSHQQTILNQAQMRSYHSWHLPRAQIPTSIAAENYLEAPLSTSSSSGIDSDRTEREIADDTFYKKLGHKMGEQRRARISEPITNTIPGSLLSDTILTQSIYDPIDELDAIIDNDDLNITFLDPLTELYEENEMRAIMNPNLQLLQRYNNS